ncbi:hypothetical protein [Microcoleus sp. herbarium14]|uniref:hypothetical protein n=1 Tax=Microcoleus sp. herbarium14 TaxID=3055439 RepID=UPI002FD241C2
MAKPRKLNNEELRSSFELLQERLIFRHDKLLLAGSFPAVGEVVSRLSWLLNSEARFIYVGVLAVSLALQRMLGRFTELESFGSCQILFQDSSTLFVLGSTPQDKIKALKHKEYNEYDQ